MALNFFEKQYYLFKKKEDYFIKSYWKTKGVLELQNGITTSKTPSTRPIKRGTKQQELQLIKGWVTPCPQKYGYSFPSTLSTSNITE